MDEDVIDVDAIKHFEDNLAALGKELSARGYQFSNGYGKLKGQAFRIAHMGDRTPEELAEYLAAIDDVLKL